MVGCSLTEAFPDTTVPGKSRKKAKASPGPALTFLKDADRQSERPPPPPDAMIKEGYADYSSDADVDVIGKAKPNKSANANANANANAAQAPIPSYFGKGADTESFADYSKSSTDNPGYQLQGSDFTTAFSAKGVEKASGGNALPTPSIDAAWKPLSDGSNYYNTHPAPYDPGQQEKQQQASASSFSREEKETLLKKLDTLFARLEELETKRNEYAHAEVTLFILSGLFFIFGLETMRKFK